MSTTPAYLNDWHRSVPRSATKQVLIGVAVLLFCCIGFGAWALYAPLSGAVVATGSFVANGQNKEVQHLEGGVIKEVLVREGDIVDAGQVVALMDGTASKARLRRLIIRRYRLLITRSRLEAQIRGHSEFEVPAELVGMKSPEVTALVERQRIELAAELKRLWSEQEVLRKEIAGLHESIRGNEVQLEAAEKKRQLFQEELKDKDQLLQRQLTRKGEVLALRRAEAELTGTIGGLSGRIADARENVARAEQQISTLDVTTVQKAVEELRVTETELDDVDEQINAAKDVVDRIEVRAPVRGAVVKINNQTKGGVISPGGALMELVPIDEELLIEARVSPREISHIRPGQTALVRLTAVNRRSTPMIIGKVVYLSADSVAETRVGPDVHIDNVQGESFVVRVSVDSNDLLAKAPTFKSTPGMPADLFIETGERTFFDYIMRPVLDSFSRAFKEA
jgi:HlyD family secretion protein